MAEERLSHPAEVHESTSGDSHPGGRLEIWDRQEVRDLLQPANQALMMP
jgi:hypothetical protein